MCGSSATNAAEVAQCSCFGDDIDHRNLYGDFNVGYGHPTSIHHMVMVSYPSCTKVNFLPNGTSRYRSC